MDNTTTVDSVYVKLLAEEHRLVISGTIKSKNSALNANAFKSKSNKFENKFKNKKNIVCFNCDKKGHYARDCKLKKKESIEVNGSASVAFLSIKNETSKMVANEIVTSKWILDSGATHHMKNVNAFESIEFDNTKVMCADGKVLIAEGKGTLNGNLNGLNVKIENVLYLPSLKANLLSISKLSASGVDISFKNGNCIGSKNGKEIFTAIKSGGLYSVLLQLNQIATAHSIALKSETLMDWHKKLAHRDINVVRKLLKDSNVNFIDSSETCESCLKGKQAKTPIPKEA